MTLLKTRQLSSPEPLFYGKTKKNQWAMVTEKIPDCSTVLDAFSETADKSRKFDLLLLICQELAKQHSKGVLQKDLHLGNFLLAHNNKVFAIDPGQMRFLYHRLRRSECISQLAALACYLHPNDSESVSKLCHEYAHSRGWHFEKSDNILFKKQMVLHRKKIIRRGLKKCLRTSRQYLRIKTGKISAVFNRDFCQKAEPLEFIKRIDTLMTQGRILKNGNTCFVSRITWNDKDIVIKRYNNKGFIHSLRHTIKKSRARHNWLHTHRLDSLGIATPKPLVYIEEYRGPLLWKSYLVAEYIEGRKLHDFLCDDSVTNQRRLDETRQVTELLRQLGKNNITHGDLKHSNILVTDNGPVIIDLDAMKVHFSRCLFKISRAKDMKRFAKHHIQS